MRFRVADQRRNVGVGEKGVGKDLGRRESLCGNYVSRSQECTEKGRFAKSAGTDGRLSMLSHDKEICSKCAEMSDMADMLCRQSLSGELLGTVCMGGQPEAESQPEGRSGCVGRSKSRTKLLPS